jgi:rod shape-determining protein MreC
MAPTSARRSGHSRRAQYGLFTGYVLAAIGAAVGAVLLGISLWRPTSFNGVRAAAADTVVPVGKASAATRAEGQGLFDSIAGYLAAGSQNAALRKEVELARIRLKEADAVRQENARLKTLLGFRDDAVKPIVVTRLVGSSAASTRRFAYLGAGSNQGVKVGMPVRSPRGIVGRVLEVGADSSRVLLLADSESVIPVRRSKDNVVAFAEGRGDGRVRIRLINLGINPLRKGDVFVTSGAGGYYHPGIAVAIVQQVTGDGAVGAVISDPAATDFVAVEPIWQPEAVKAAETPVETAVGE